MFDRQRLRDNILACLAVSILSAALGAEAMAVVMVAIAGILGSLFFSLRPTVLSFRAPAKDLYDHRPALNEFKNKYREDEQFRGAVDYLYEMSPTEFLRFVRLMCEVRDEAGQKALKDVGDLFRRSQ